MKWFPKAHAISDAAARETPVPDFRHDMASDTQRVPRQSRLSATFGDSKPWSLMPSSQPVEQDRASRSLSRKRRSLFGSRSSNASISQVPPESSHRSISPMTPFPAQRAVGSDRPGSAMSNASLSGRTSRASIFTSRTSSRLMRAGENLHRYSNSFRSSFSFHHGDADDEDACDYARFGSGYLGNEPATDRPRPHRKVSKHDISLPFDFVHVSHTQRSQISMPCEPESKSWAAAAHRAPQAAICGDSTEQERTDSRLYQNGGIERAQMEATLASLRCERGPSAGTGTGPLPNNAFSPRPPYSRHGSFSDLRLIQMRGELRGAPPLVHPAFRATSTPSTDALPLSNGSVYDAQIKNLDSVPEEIENPSPGRWRQDFKKLLDTKPLPSPPGSSSNSDPDRLLFPAGNAFAQAQTEILNDQTASDADGSLPSLTSGDSWENEVELLYRAEAESTCEFDWSSSCGSRETQDRRDSGATTSTVASSKHHSARSRQSSANASENWEQDDALFAEFDGVSPGAAPPSSHKLGNGRPVSGRYSTISTVSTSNAELTTIQELASAGSQDGTDDGIDTPVCAVQRKHARPASYNHQKPAVLRKAARWSIASPLYLPEDAKLRTPSFTSNTTASFAGQMLFGAPLFPPPATPLPKVPAVASPSKRASVLLTPPMSPPALCEPDFTYMRRPACSQDRALLQAAGRTVQRGRQGQSRPSTPSRLSNMQNGKMMPTTPPGSRSMVYSLSTFPTPPTSPPPHQCEQYPAWI